MSFQQKLFALTFFVFGITLTAVNLIVRPSSWFHELSEKHSGFIPPPQEEYYLAADAAGDYQQRILLHGDLDTLRYVKAAEVIFVGNSRLMMALYKESLAPFFQQVGLKYYMLGFGAGAQDAFALEVIRRLDLHPKVVVVNADRFFTGDLGAVGKYVVDESSFDIAKARFEGDVGEVVRRRLRDVAPHLTDAYVRLLVPVVYRSRFDGTWWIPRPWIDKEGAEMGPPVDRPGPMPELTLHQARAFKAEMDARGARMILTLVPWGGQRRLEAAQIAKELGVPFLAPYPTGLKTLEDFSHLNLEGAHRFAAALLGQLKEELAKPPLNTRKGP